jgi:hypothetical protein
MPIVYYLRRRHFPIPSANGSEALIGGLGERRVRANGRAESRHIVRASKSNLDDAGMRDF